MAYSDGTRSLSVGEQSSMSTAVASRLPVTKTEGVRDHEVAQGRIFRLPPREELPLNAVRRAYGNGTVDEGMYNHPVVVISRPEEEPEMVHFHLITSFQGRTLEEIYGYANEYNATKRSWYLPIWPAPDHPDASSKKAKKRFPTLGLAGDGQLRMGSYVNLRDVYKIEWAHLRPYTNPDTPECSYFRLFKQSTARMLAKSRALTNYEPGRQCQSAKCVASASDMSQEASSQETEVPSSAVVEGSAFQVLQNAEGVMSRPPTALPDPGH